MAEQLRDPPYPTANMIEITSDGLKQQMSRAETLATTTIAGTELLALLEVAQEVRSPQAVKLIHRLRTVSQLETVELAGEDMRLLLKIALHAKTRGRTRNPHKAAVSVCLTT